MARETTNKRKALLIQALIDTLGIVTTACQKSDISRNTFYVWYREDEVFAKQVDDIAEIALDFAESKLHSLIKDENPTSIIFYLKTKGKNRGYIERQEFDHTTDGDKIEPPTFIFKKLNED